MAVSASRWRRTRPWKSALLVHRTIFVLSLLLLTSEGYLAATHFSASRPHSTQFCHVATSTHHDASIVEQNTWEGAAVGLYVHIPYCRRRCRYCDFAIVPIGNSALTDETNESEQQHSIEEPSSAIRATRGFLDMDAAYRTAVLKEIDTIQTRFNGTKIPLQSIYFGGGTPSLAPVATLEAILSTILDENSPFLLEKDAEVSIEMDPGTFSRYKLNVIKNMGFNRVSLGVQSFNDNVLESIGRCHRQADIYESISLLQQVYGEDVNYSMDLISGLPGVSLALWAETLEIATNLVPRPNHLSLYDLQVESGTVFGKWYDDAGNDSDRTRGSAPVNVPGLPSPDDCAFAYKYASSYLRAKGYEHYEISSYAFRGDEQEVPLPYRSRHNQIYWQSGSQWFAVGLGATSSINGSRFARPRALTDYISWVEEGASVPETDSPKLDHDMLTDIIMTRLRTSEGLDLDWIREHVPNGANVVEKILKGSQLGLDMNLADHTRSKSSSSSEGTLRLVDPDGFLFSNSIISSIFVELES